MNSHRILLSLILCCSLSFVWSQKQELFHTYYHKDSVSSIVFDLLDELDSSHPGFSRYTSKTAHLNYAKEQLAELPDSVNLLAAYRLLKPMVAKIGCLHTGISFSEEFEETLADSLDLLPFDIMTDGATYATIRQTYGPDQKLRKGDTIVSINGMKISSVLETLKENIPSDGYNETLKFRLLNYTFSSWYQTILSNTNSSSIEILRADGSSTWEIDHIASSFFPAYEELVKRNIPQLSFDITDESIGVLTVRTFSNSRISNQNQKFKKFIKNTFKELEEKSISKLLIDVRDNTGGTDSNAALLASYFHEGEFRYWDRIEVTEKIAGQIKGIHRLFYPKPEKIDTSYHWKGAFLTKEFDYTAPIEAPQEPYQGSVYILTNGLCMSSCSDFVANLHFNQKAMVLGEETGGGYQGNTSGMMPEAQIIDGINITVPLQKYTNAVDPDKFIGFGTKPDVELKGDFPNEIWIDQTLEIINISQ